MNLTYRFNVDDNLRTLMACETIAFVHDDGIYLVAWDGHKKRYLARPDNGNLGLDAGCGDDFSEELSPMELPPAAVTLIIGLTDEAIEIGYEERVAQ